MAIARSEVSFAEGQLRRSRQRLRRFMSDPGDVTRLLDAANGGDRDALNAVLALLHNQLRSIAHYQLARESTGHTLETMGLVNEAYLRLLGVERVTWQDRQHLLAMAARAMRRVLIDYADRRRAAKRGSGVADVPIDQVCAAEDERSGDLLALDEALSRLEQLAPRQSLVVECRFFGGLSIEETATALQLSTATVKREWTAARAWLNRELTA